jgi:hypothetical protein
VRSQECQTGGGGRIDDDVCALCRRAVKRKRSVGIIGRDQYSNCVLHSIVTGQTTGIAGKVQPGTTAASKGGSCDLCDGLKARSW